VTTSASVPATRKICVRRREHREAEQQHRRVPAEDQQPLRGDV
jgi:hypothetical protein